MNTSLHRISGGHLFLDLPVVLVRLDFSISQTLSLLQENQSLYVDQMFNGDLVDWTFKCLDRLSLIFLSCLWTIALPWQNCYVQYDRICGEIKFYSMLITQLLHHFMEVIM